MFNKTFKKFYLILALTLMLLTAGCGSEGLISSFLSGQVSSAALSVGPALALKGSDFVNSITTQVTVLQALNPLVAGDWAKFLNYFGDIVRNRRFDIELHKMLYSSKRSDGSTVILSGLLILPRNAGGPIPDVPILMYQHATEPYRANAPSQYLSFGRNPLDFPEVIIAAAMASTGYAVALPDYQGMGDNLEIQPFVHARTLAVQVVDMLRATRDSIRGLVGGFTSSCSWNGKLFLMGYSEGGFVTLAAVRELQLNHAGEFTVTAAAPMAGPHDLSGVMRNLILADAPFKAPYFLPFVLSSYYSVYQDQKLSPSYTMVYPFNYTLPLVLNGSVTGETINMTMGMSYSPVWLIVPKSILSTSFIADLQNPGSAISGYLHDNDTYRGWAPNMPIRLFHNPSDDLVPYANSQVAYSAFSSAGAKRWVSLVPSPDTIFLKSSTVPTVHVAGAVPELHDAWLWFYTTF